LQEDARIKILKWQPKKHGRCVEKLKKDSQDTFPRQHHPNSKPEGMNATSGDENADILKNHFQAVFDRRDVTTDETVIDKIEELDIAGDLKE
jgi:hypothetical protein